VNEKAENSTEKHEKSNEQSESLSSVLPEHAVYYFLKGRYYRAEKIEVEELSNLLKEVFPEIPEECLEDATMLFALKEEYVEGWYPYYGTVFPQSKRVLIKAAIFDKHFLMKR
jgi:hypothetical protein